MESEKKTNKVLLVIVFILLFAVGFLAGQLVSRDNLKKEEKIEEKESIEEKEKVEEKEETKEETKEEEYTEEENKENGEHTKCGLCSEAGEFCCGAGPGVTYDDMHIDLKDNAETFKNFKSEVFDLHNDNYSYKVQFIKNNTAEKVIVNNETIYDKTSGFNVEDIFLLDNGMIGIQYYNPDDQDLHRRRDYFDKKLNLVKTIDGINSKDKDLFAKEFKYSQIDRCVNNEYKEIKVYKASIKDGKVDTEYTGIIKEDGCAGMV